MSARSIPTTAKVLHWISCLAIAAAVSLRVNAVVLIGNMPSTALHGRYVISASTGLSAMSLAVTFAPDEGYTVDDAVLRLSNYDTSAGDVATVSIYSDSSSGSPDSLVGSFTSPTSANNGAGSFCFTPSS